MQQILSFAASLNGIKQKTLVENVFFHQQTSVKKNMFQNFGNFL